MIVLNYHGISEGPPVDRWCLPRKLFEDQVVALRRHLIGPTEFLASCDDAPRRRSQHVLFTFDDGNLSDYTIAFPTIADGSGPGFISFITVDEVGKPGRVNWRMLDEMSRHGIEVGSHGMTHRNMTNLSRGEVVDELRRSKSELEARLGKKVNLFAFPYGRFTVRLAREAIRVGYTRLFTIQLGHHRGFEPYLVSRLCMTNDVAVAALARHVADPDAMRGRAYQLAKRFGIYPVLMRIRYR